MKATLENQLFELQKQLLVNKKGLKFWTQKDNSDKYIKVIKEYVQAIEEDIMDINITLKKIKEYAE